MELAPMSTCQQYGAGHQMHWIHWRHARSARPVEVTLVSIDDGRLVLTLADGEQLRWWHHQLSRLRQAIEIPRAEIEAVPSFHALHVNNWWFNCSPDPSPAPCWLQEASR